ncbi:Coiled-coil domain-containing protein 61 [Tetrabaena socialis]|uniref:Coiled-coil domain-containing protein 61 n=1 Tax=Tetrabaena socialis TaxID=47790 RepID=A0A2J8ACJ5_9CHLO|nr:Coiled-coil domain-containing protein 61 [Tetrabaena socialis]|eukprot:PNH10242.1 Coiled-coil domain-containing protein 61 [Tetrabaena socialis]
MAPATKPPNWLCGAFQVDVAFHGVAYLLTVSTIDGETLCLEVEQKSDCSRWRGDFTSRYIEDITSKTGNFKKFPVFVKMLLSALKQASDSVFVLKSRKAGGQAPQPRTQPPNNKRYLILTYAAEFDRVHYPLPLLYEDNPDPQHLKRIISQLRVEVEALQAEAGSRRGGSEASAELRRLREENSALKHQIRNGGGGGGALEQDQERLSAEARELSKELRTVRKERDLLQARVEAAEVELERERGLHRRELRRRGKEQQELVDEVGRCKEQIRELKMRIRQLTEDMEGRDRRMTSTDRIRCGRACGVQTIAPSACLCLKGSPRSISGAGEGSRLSPSYVPPARGVDSRSNSRGRQTSSAERSRPNSAPVGRPSPRFDPTEYVRQRKEREGGRRSNAPTPPRSGPSSRASSIVGSRPPSADRLPAVRNGGGSQSTSRPSSTERYRPGAGGGGPPGRTSAGSSRGGADRSGPRAPDPLPAGPRSRGMSPSGRPVAAWGEGGAGSGGGGGWSKFPAGAAGNSAGGGNRIATSSPRSMSPARALQEVKQKLSNFVAGRGGALTDEAQNAQGDQASQGSKAQVFDDASAEIADIDSRLHALQSFLRMAKSTSAATSTATGLT